ncbi:MAG: peptide chain release factor N(5)-glutamine methyltransferase [Coriobacteriia bacterium]|nr:peptide chain release factor N(5)-glutamine methyltransferase [Coriobacteriia bacterium]
MSPHNWTVLEALQWCTAYLEEHGDENPRLSAQWLLSHATGLSRIEVYAHHDRPLTVEERATLREMLPRRATGEPLQHILGEAAFRALTLHVTPDVLIPRPETEHLVDLVREHVMQEHRDALVRILDIGTGSGAVAVALVHELPGAQVTAVDISEAALNIARTNADNLGLTDRVTFVQSDCYVALAPDARFDVIVANPPYIPTAQLATLPREVREHEPIAALDGGTDGLDIFRAILDGAYARLTDKGALFVELDERNVTQAAQLAVKLEVYPNVAVHNDLTGRPRYVIAERM